MKECFSGNSASFKSMVLAILCFFFMTNNSIAQQDSWTRKADYAEGFSTSSAVAFSVNGKGYVGLGYYNRKEFWEYDPINDTWSQKSDFPGKSRMAAIAFVVDGKAYVGAGFSGSGLFPNDFYEYDPSNDTWTQIADYPGTTISGAVSFSIENRGYIVTGDIGSGKEFWEYNPSLDIWTSKPNFIGSERDAAIGFSIDGKGYIGTGRLNTNELKDFWEYDPMTETWTRKADFGGEARYSAVGFALNGKGYIGTGNTQGPIGNEVNDFWRYNPKTDSWSQISDFGGAVRDRAISFVIGDKAYVGTGYHFTGGGKLNYSDIWEITDLCTEENSIEEVELCSGETITINGESYDSEGTFMQNLISAQGCDSIVYIVVEVIDHIEREESYMLCNGESITVNGELFTDEGSYEQRLLSSQGCDTLLNVIIDVVENIQKEETFTICEGDSINVLGEYYDREGVYQQIVFSSQSCDTVLNIVINVIENMVMDDNYSICEGDSINVNAEVFSSDGIFQQHLVSSYGCDSLVNISISTVSSSFYIPNVFNPNSINIENRFFRPYFENDVQAYQLQIYDRLGNLVFSSSNNPWDGKINGNIAAQGVYVYVVNTDDICNKNQIVGSVTLIR